MVDFDLLVDPEQAADAVARSGTPAGCPSWRRSRTSCHAHPRFRSARPTATAPSTSTGGSFPGSHGAGPNAISPSGRTPPPSRSGSGHPGAGGPRSAAPRDPARVPVGVGARSAMGRRRGRAPADTTGTLEWDRFVQPRARAHLALPVADALEYVADDVRGPGARSVREHVPGRESTRRERRKHACGGAGARVTAPLAPRRTAPISEPAGLGSA